jgi:WD40 repeat protein
MPYTEAEQEFFFGRDQDIDLISDNLQAYPLSVLFGPSGVGKSSVLQAGVVPRLRGENTRRAELFDDVDRTVVVYCTSWRDDPASTLAREITSFLSAAPGRAVSSGELDSMEIVALCAKEELDLLVVLDQFEEYFVYHRDSGDAFARELAVLLTPGSRANMLLAIREDALAQLDAFEAAIPAIFHNTLRLEHLDADSAREAIVKPLARFNARVPDERRRDIEPALVERLLRQVQTGRVHVDATSHGSGASSPTPTGSTARVETPFLQLVLTRLWEEEKDSASVSLRESTLLRLGGAQAIVRQHLDRVIVQFDGSERAALAAALEYLVTPSGTKIAHSASDLAALTAVDLRLMTSVLRRLCEGDRRILRQVPGAADDPQPESRYEIFHDVLAPAVLDWRRRWLADEEAKEQQGELLMAKERAEAETHETRRRLRRTRLLLAAVALLSVAAVIATVIAVNQVNEAERQSSEAERQRNEAQALSLATKADTIPPSNAALALALAVESRTHTQQYVEQATAALIRARVNFERAGVQAVRTPLSVEVGGVTSVAFSPDGDMLATAGDNGIVRRWLPETGEPVGEPIRAGSPINSVSFSPDGTLLATAGDDGVVSLWSPADGRRVRSLGHGGRVTTLAFSPDGKILAAGHMGGAVHLWNPISGRPLTQGPLSQGEGTTSVAFSPNGRLLASASSDSHGRGSVRLWDPTTGRSVGTPLRLNHGVESVAFNPAGNLLAIGEDLDGHVVRLWDPTTGRYVGPPLDHDSGVHSLAFSPNGKLLATGSGFESGGELELWNTTTSRPVGKPLDAHPGQIRSLAFSPDGTLVATGGSEGSVQLWDPEAGRPAPDTLLARHRAIDAVTFNPDGDRMATVGNGGVRLWDPATGMPAGKLSHARHVRSGALWFTTDGKRLVVVGERRVRLWDPNTGREFGSPLKPPQSGFLVAATGNLAAFTEYNARGTGKVRLWDVTTGDPVGVPIKLGTAFANTVAISSDGGLLAIVDGNLLKATVQLWDISTGRRVRGLPVTRAGIVEALALSPDGTVLVTGGSDGVVRLWDTASGDPIGGPLAGITGSVNAVAFNAEGTLLAAGGSGGTIMLWDAATLLPIGGRLSGHTYPISSVVFSPAGGLLVSVAFNSTLRTWHWDVQEACDIAARYVTRDQVESYVPSGWDLHCDYTE